ncbi:MAG: hypothetical protein ACI9MR_005056 [Myxococcota bacterium]|jgi:hypothetical protein
MRLASTFLEMFSLQKVKPVVGVITILMVVPFMSMCNEQGDRSKSSRNTNCDWEQEVIQRTVAYDCWKLLGHPACLRTWRINGYSSERDCAYAQIREATKHCGNLCGIEARRADGPPGVGPAKVAKPSKMTPPGGRFAIAFPRGVVPTVNDQNVETAAGDMTTKVWMAEVGSGVYIVNYTDMPPKLLAGGNGEKFLDGGRDGALRTFNATLIKEERYTVKGAPGIRFWYRGVARGTTIYGRTDALFASPRIYQVQYLAETESAIGSTRVMEFFDSFALIGDTEFGPKLTTGPDGSFSIALPPSFPDAKTTHDVVESPAGEMTLTMMTALTAKGAVSVAYSDVPGEGPLGPSDFDGSRDACCELAALNLNARKILPSRAGLRAACGSRASSTGRLISAALT